MDKSCQGQDCAESLHLLEPPGLHCSLKLCQNSKYILNFIYCGPPLLLWKCSSSDIAAAKELNGIQLSPT